MSLSWGCRRSPARARPARCTPPDQRPSPSRERRSQRRRLRGEDLGGSRRIRRRADRQPPLVLLPDADAANGFDCGDGLLEEVVADAGRYRPALNELDRRRRRRKTTSSTAAAAWIYESRSTPVRRLPLSTVQHRDDRRRRCTGNRDE